MRLTHWCPLLVFALSAVAADIPPIQPDWVLVSRPLKWQSTPKHLHLKSKTAEADVIVLNPSGAFAAVHCFLIRQGRTITVTRDDSHSVTAGTWIAAGSVLSVKSQLVYADVLPMGRPVPAPESEAEYAVTSAGRSRTLSRNGVMFKRLGGFKELDSLAAMVACDRTYWDGAKFRDGVPSPCETGVKGR